MSAELFLLHFAASAAVSAVSYLLGLRARRNRNGLRLGRRDRPRFRRTWTMGR